MLEKFLAVTWLSLVGGLCTNASAVVVSIDVDSNFVAISSFTQDEYRFQSVGTFNVLNSTPDHIVANGATSLGGYTMRRVDGEAFTLFGVNHSGPATIGGIETPNTNTFGTFSFPIGDPGIDAVTSVLIDIDPGAVFKLAGFTVEVVSPIPPNIPLPAAGWLLLSALGVLTYGGRARRRAAAME